MKKILNIPIIDNKVNLPSKARILDIQISEKKNKSSLIVIADVDATEVQTPIRIYKTGFQIDEKELNLLRYLGSKEDHHLFLVVIIENPAAPHE